MSSPAPRWTSFVALGDSFTEGLADRLPDGTYRGWADRVADLLAERVPDFRYANLAVRGKLVHQVLAEQVPVAVGMRPDLVSLFAGVNDLLRPRVDLAAVDGAFEEAVARLREAGSDVLLFTGGGAGMAAGSSGSGRVALRIAHLNAVVTRLAATYGCRVADVAHRAVFAHRDMWDEDRLHLSPLGHARVAAIVAEALDLPGDGSWRQPLPAASPVPWRRARQEDLRWARRYAAPWVVRRVRGRSSGDGVSAKRPALDVLQPRPDPGEGSDGAA